MTSEGVVIVSLMEMHFTTVAGGMSLAMDATKKNATAITISQSATATDAALVRISREPILS